MKTSSLPGDSFSHFTHWRTFIWLCVCALSGISSSAHGEDAKIVIEKNVPAVMRDGVILRADVRRPDRDGRHPVLIFRTPYDKDEGDADNEKTFAEAVRRGYVMVIQDVRGRYASDGGFVAYQNEGKDGYDTIEWAAQQPWSDGRVGTFGLSYPGAVQWLAAVENPPHLKAMVPAMCPSTMGPQCIYFGGVFESGWANWSYINMSPDTRVRKNLPGPKTIPEAKAEWARLGGADTIQGWLPSLQMPYLKEVEPYHYTWLEHGPYDPWWEWGNFRTKYGNVKAAVLNISGWHDEPYGSEGAITNFLGIVSSRRNDPDPRSKLILGPWIHGVDATGQDVAGERKLGPGARIDYHSVVLDWLDHYVRGLDNGVEKWPNVRAYVMGADTWETDASWPLRKTELQPFYLASTATPGHEAGGIATHQALATGTSSFPSDPANPVKDTKDTNWGGFDLRDLSENPSVLAFETAPFVNDIAIVGNGRAEIRVSSDAPDFDLYLRLIDVAPDGTAYNLEGAGHEVVRVSLRDKTQTPRLLKPGEIVTVNFDNLITGNLFKKGHRLRVYLIASWFPTYSRNLQTGKSETVSSETQKAVITIHHSAETPSCLWLPVVASGNK